jgi:hypothetical protein
MRQTSRVALGGGVQQDVSQYTDRVCTAISSGLQAWQAQAKFKNIKIMAIAAIGAPGCLDGPNLGSLMKPLCPQSTTWERQMTEVVARAVGSAWADQQRSVTVPGLPWYPAFAAWPGPMAPPTPNVPTPFVACPQRSVQQTASAIKDAIRGSTLAHASEVAGGVSAGFQAGFLSWVGGVIVRNVLGKGPVPSFAPPYVPVGPVVNGSVISIPGHLL